MVKKADGNDTIDIECELRSDPEASKGHLLYDGSREEWFPQSLVQLERVSGKQNLYTVTMPVWLAEKKGFV